MLVERTVGEREDITAVATYPEPVNMAGVVITYWMRLLGSTTWKVAGAEAEPPEDVSAQHGAQAGTVWLHRYRPTTTDVDTEGRYDAKFRQDFSNGQYRYIPADSEQIRVVVVGPEPTSP